MTSSTAAAAAASKTSTSALQLLLLVVLLLSTLPASLAGSASGIRTAKLNSQIPRCCDMSSEDLCSQNPSCRWCRSESLDDMCFAKSVALRLPPQVFTCKLIRFSQKF